MVEPKQEVLAATAKCRMVAARVAACPAGSTLACSWLGTLAFVVALFASPPANATSTDGAAYEVVFPVVVATSSYKSRIHLLNESEVASSATITYFGSAGTATPGIRACGAVSLPAFGTADIDFAEICSLGPGSHFGLLRVSGEDYLSGYSRVSNPGANGFSVDAFPIGNFYGGELAVLGLRKSSSAPGYQTNCFVGSLDEAAHYSIRLFNPAGTQLGNVITGTLAANELVRHLDVFAAAGLGAGEAADVRAEITATDPNKPALIAFCTVQNNSNFDADFRIGKSRFGAGADSMKSLPGISPGAPFIDLRSHRYGTIIAAPDRLSCAISGPAAQLLEMRLLGPDGRPRAGGPNASSFSYDTGPRGSLTGGRDGIWQIEVRPRSGVTAFPIAYTFDCDSGSGMTALVQLADGTYSSWVEPAASVGTLAAGTTLLSPGQLAQVITETETEVVLPASIALQPGDVFVTPNGAYKVTGRVDSGAVAALAVTAPAIEEVFSELSIRSSPDSAQSRAQLKSQTITVTVGPQTLNAAFEVDESPLVVTGSFDVTVPRKPLVDVDFRLFDGGLQRAQLELDTTVVSNIQFAIVAEGEKSLNVPLGKFRIPIPTNVVDLVTGLFGVTTVSIVVPVSLYVTVKAAASMEASATGTATLKARFSYSKANGIESATTADHTLTLGDPTVEQPTFAYKGSIAAGIRARPALGFLDTVGLIGVDVRAGVLEKAEYDPLPFSTPPYCIKVEPFYEVAGFGFAKFVGFQERRTSEVSVLSSIGPPWKWGTCSEGFSSLACNLERSAAGGWRWAISGALPVPPQQAPVFVGAAVNGYQAVYNNNIVNMTDEPYRTLLKCDGLVPYFPSSSFNSARCSSDTDVLSATSVSFKFIEQRGQWYCGGLYDGCYGYFGNPGPDGYFGPLDSTGQLAARFVVRNIAVSWFHGAARGDDVVTCPAPPTY